MVNYCEATNEGESYFKVVGITVNSIVYGRHLGLNLVALAPELCDTNKFNGTDDWALVPVKKYQELCEDSRRLELIKEWTS